MTSSTSGAKFTVSALLSFPASIFERGQAMKKMKGASKDKVKTTKGVARKAGTKARSKADYNPQTGALTGRAVGAQARRELLIADFEAEGLSRPEAKARALAMMRDNNTGDWRKGKR